VQQELCTSRGVPEKVAGPNYRDATIFDSTPFSVF
jgi:hypothetical protein